MNTPIKLTTLALMMSLAWSAMAAEPEAATLQAPAKNLQQATQKAIAKNPEVQAAWHIFQASTEEERVAEGRYLPKVDLTGAVGNQ